MKKRKIISQLHQILNNESLRLTYSDKKAISEAIEIIENNEFDPVWIILLLETLGIGISILQKAP